MQSLFLVVDPHHDESEHTHSMLQRLQPRATVLLAESGAAAFGALTEQRVVPSLVLVEFNLPDMNAIEFLGRVRSERWLATSPVAVLSRMVPDRVIVESYRLGSKAFLAKPVALHELQDVVREFARPARWLDTGGIIMTSLPEPVRPRAA